jgi:predicted DNA-binding transcriptional regulator AlpA
MVRKRTCREKAATAISGLDRLITEQATAEILGISPDTLRRLNLRGEGPTRRNISPRRVGYKLSEVEAYRDRKPLTTPKQHKSARSSPGARARESESSCTNRRQNTA